MPAEGYLPGFDGATGWLNTQPLTAEGLRGKVVLVDFWTYTCINWLRTLAYIRAWAEKYKDRGLVVVGVHTPEFPFEQNVDNVRRAANDMNVSTRSRSIPTTRSGAHSATGTGRRFTSPTRKDESATTSSARAATTSANGASSSCCTRPGADGIPDGLVSPTPEGFEAQADWTNLRSPETYLGYAQGRNFASRGGAEIGGPSTYEAPEMLMLNQWALAGDWTIESGASVLNAADGRITFRFHARDAHLVMGPPASDTAVPFRVLLDGEPPGDAHGLDVDEQGHGTVSQQRLYQLVRERGSITDRTLELTFLAAGVEAYVFTFG